MKNKYLYLAVILSFSIFSSCEKDSSNPKKMGATVDGQTWEASLRVTTLTNGIFVITGTSGGTTIAITINGETTGTYTLALPLKTEFGATYIITTPGSSTATTYASTSGKVELTKVDKISKTISGTFEFTAVNKELNKTIPIKNGEFNDLIYE